MLIDFNYLWKKYHIEAKGVLHVGASTGQEADAYYANGITHSVWIEAIPEVFEDLKKNLEKYPNAIAIKECISDVNGDEVTFNIANNQGQSSSFLKLGTHSVVHPEVKYVRKIKLKTRRIDDLFGSLKDYPFVNLDLQGVELLALKGMGELIKEVNYFYIEINKAPLYQNCALVGDIDRYLFGYGFKRVETQWAGNTGWGDGFYIRK